MYLKKQTLRPWYFLWPSQLKSPQTAHYLFTRFSFLKEVLGHLVFKAFLQLVGLCNWKKGLLPSGYIIDAEKGCFDLDIAEHLLLSLFSPSLLYKWLIPQQQEWFRPCGTPPAYLNKLSITLKAFPDTDVCQHLQASANWMSAFWVFSVSPQCLLNSWGIYQKCQLDTNTL